MSEVFSIPLRVYYEDTDAGGVVYYANYLKFIERCRSEWLIAAGHPIDQFEHHSGALFVVRRVHAEYYAPARLMDALTVTSRVVEMRRVQFTALQTVVRGDERLFEATVTLACIDRRTFKPVAIPPHLHSLFRP
jgi:acyl-CoA thioester hydrolase